MKAVSGGICYGNVFVPFTQTSSVLFLAHCVSQVYFLAVLMSCGKANVCIPACQILSVCAEVPGWVSSWFKEPCNVSEGMGEHGEEKTAK